MYMYVGMVYLYFFFGFRMSFIFWILFINSYSFVNIFLDGICIFLIYLMGEWMSVERGSLFIIMDFIYNYKVYIFFVDLNNFIIDYYNFICLIKVNVNCFIIR